MRDANYSVFLLARDAAGNVQPGGLTRVDVQTVDDTPPVFKRIQLDGERRPCCMGWPG